MKVKNKIVVLIIISMALIVFGAYVYYGLGRSMSRVAGKGYRQVLIIPHSSRFISISFDKRGQSTVKDITFVAVDGFHYTKEYKDFSPLEGIIRWVPYGTGSDLIQSRTLSRWFGDVVNLELPSGSK